MNENDVTKTPDLPFISVKEAASIMGYSRNHIVRLIKSGQVKANRVGRSYIVDRRSLGGVYRPITKVDKSQIDRAVKKIVGEYGEALKKLGKE